MTTETDDMTTRYLSDRDLAARYSIARQTVWRWVVRGWLPQPVSITPGTTRWLEAEIERHDAARAPSAPSRS